jgi:hypothetical protein
VVGSPVAPHRRRVAVGLVLALVLLPAACTSGGRGSAGDTPSPTTAAAPATTEAQPPIRLTFTPNPVARGQEVTVIPIEGTTYRHWELVLWADGDTVGLLSQGGWQPGTDTTVGAYDLLPTSDAYTLLVSDVAPAGTFLACFLVGDDGTGRKACGPLTIV